MGFLIIGLYPIFYLSINQRYTQYLLRISSCYKTLLRQKIDLIRHFMWYRTVHSLTQLAVLKNQSLKTKQMSILCRISTVFQIINPSEHVTFIIQTLRMQLRLKRWFFSSSNHLRNINFPKYHLFWKTWTLQNSVFATHICTKNTFTLFISQKNLEIIELGYKNLYKIHTENIFIWSICHTNHGCKSWKINNISSLQKIWMYQNINRFWKHQSPEVLNF